MLTPKQELYCQNRALKQMSKLDAYRGAYSADRMSNNAVSVEACRLEALPNVALRIEELKAEQAAEIKKENKWSRDKAYNELTWLIEKAKSEMEMAERISMPCVKSILDAVKELNGIYDVTEDPEETEQDGFIEALNGKANEVWDDEKGDIPL